MKVGFICQPFDDCAPPVPNQSIALITWELARRLRRSAGVVVCAPRLSNQNAEDQWEAVQFYRIKLTLDSRLVDKPRRLNGPLSESRTDVHSVLYCPFYALQCALRLRATDCDIIHIHNFSQFVPIARLLNPKAKLVLHMNCDWLAQFDGKRIKKRLRHADAIVSCTDYIGDRVKVLFPHYADRCITIYNGTDVDNSLGPSTGLTRPQKSKRFLFVGRVSPEKGVHVLLDAFKLVLNREPDATLTIVGGAHVPPLSFIVNLSRDPKVRELRRFYNSEYMDYLQGMVKSMPANKVSFAGFVPHNQLPSFFELADVLVQSSVWDEPFGIPVVEAMAAGLPVVSSRSGGLPEIIVDGTTGLLVERDNPAALAEAMSRLISNNEMALNMGAAGKSRAKALFSWDVVTARLLALYEVLISATLRELPKNISG